VVVNSGEVVTIRVRWTQQDGSAFPFDATTGPGYVWHCHILEHEDNEMMRPYIVVAANTPLNSLTIEVGVAVAIVALVVVLVAVVLLLRVRRKVPK